MLLVDTDAHLPNDEDTKLVFASADTDAPVDSLYMVSDWLHSHEFGEALYLGLLDVASSCETEDGANDSDKPETLAPDAAFDAFLEEVTIVRRAWQSDHHQPY